MSHRALRNAYRPRYTLTPRGERLLGFAYTVLITVGAAAALLLMLGIAGWIEGLS